MNEILTAIKAPLNIELSHLIYKYNGVFFAAAAASLLQWNVNAKSVNYFISLLMWDSLHTKPLGFQHCFV